DDEERAALMAIARRNLPVGDLDVRRQRVRWNAEQVELSSVERAQSGLCRRGTIPGGTHDHRAFTAVLEELAHRKAQRARLRRSAELPLELIPRSDKMRFG